MQVKVKVPGTREMWRVFVVIIFGLSILALAAVYMAEYHPTLEHTWKVQQ